MPPPPLVYATDLSDVESAIVAPLLPPAEPGGRPRKWPIRTITDGIVYVIHCDCQRRVLPSYFASPQTVSHYFRLFRLDGTWEQLNGVLRERERVRLGRKPQPRAATVTRLMLKRLAPGMTLFRPLLAILPGRRPTYRR